MMMNSFGNESFMQPMRRLSMHALMRDPIIFFFLRRGKGLFSLVLDVFP
jgi:hypothetical protein